MNIYLKSSVSSKTKGRGQKNRRFFRSLSLQVGGNVKDHKAFLLISPAFVGVFQNDPGPPKYALELRDYVKFNIVWNLRSER